jgi:glycine/D-amino acid oxidase-like deaminating enzyme
MILDSKIPGGPISEKWTRHKFELKLVNPANKRKFTVIVVGTGLAGASAAASLGELGYNVKAFCIQDSPRRAHSIAAQGGINAAKNYTNDGDSVYRLFYDTVKAEYYTQYWVAIDPETGIPCQEREFKQGVHTMVNPTTGDTATFKSNITLERLYTMEKE